MKNTVTFILENREMCGRLKGRGENYGIQTCGSWPFSSFSPQFFQLDLRIFHYNRLPKPKSCFWRWQDPVDVGDIRNIFLPSTFHFKSIWLPSIMILVSLQIHFNFVYDNKQIKYNESNKSQFKQFLW